MTEDRSKQILDSTFEHLERVLEEMRKEKFDRKKESLSRDQKNQKRKISLGSG